MAAGFKERVEDFSSAEKFENGFREFPSKDVRSYARPLTEVFEAKAGYWCLNFKFGELASPFNARGVDMISAGSIAPSQVIKRVKLLEVDNNKCVGL